MFSKLVCLLMLAASLAGCVPGQNLVPESDGSRFLLREDAIRKYPRRYSMGEDWVLGLKRGEYIAIGHDDEGVYYRGPQDCLVRLISELGDQYLATGLRPDPVVAYGRQFGLVGNDGGVYVPYDPQDKPSYFFYLDYRAVTGETASRIPSPPDSVVNRELFDLQVSMPKADVPANPDSTRELADIAAQSVLPGNSLPTMQAQQAGTAIGLAVGKSWAMSAQREAQGRVVLGFYVEDERILSALKQRSQTPATGW